MTAAPAWVLCWGTVEGAGLLETAEAAAAAGFAEISITPAMSRLAAPVPRSAGGAST